MFYPTGLILSLLMDEAYLKGKLCFLCSTYAKPSRKPEKSKNKQTNKRPREKHSKTIEKTKKNQKDQGSGPTWRLSSLSRLHFTSDPCFFCFLFWFSQWFCYAFHWTSWFVLFFLVFSMVSHILHGIEGFVPRIILPPRLLRCRPYGVV